jgi:hypothetical protein
MPLAASCPACTGRSTSERTDATGVPVASAASTDRPPAASRRSLTRSADAPAACTDTPSQANGSRASPGAVGGLFSADACSAASSSAGCSPYPAAPPAPSGRVTSAKTSVPRRQAVRSPRNEGPYAYPPEVSPSYRPPVSARTAPSGGQARKSAGAGGAAGGAADSSPLACSVQAASPPAGRACISTARCPSASGPATVT